MKACLFKEYGSPSVLEFAEQDIPEPKDNEVLIKVHASSVNDWDWQLLQGIPFINRLFNGINKPKKVTILGCDVAGKIEAVGKNVTSHQVGDEVYGDLSDCGFGAYAEYVCAKEDAVITKPVNLSFEQAASLPQAAIIALQGFQYAGGPRTGQKLLINGASGGVGPLALQMARYFEAKEITCVCSGAKMDFVRSFGADHVIDYQKEDFTRNNKTYDLIMDVKGFHKFFDYKRALTPNGIYALQGGGNSIINQTLALGWLVSLFTSKKMGIQIHKANQGLELISEMVTSGKLKPVIDSVFPWQKLPEAISYYGAGKAKGKVVISMEN